MRVLDLFSGIGGFSLGLESTGFFKTVQFVENEKWCQKILRKNFPGIPIHDDIKTFKGYDADLVVGGFPCQPFSVAGKQKAIQDDRHLWPEMFRVIKETKPTWVIGENVRNIISISDGMVLEQVYLDLESEGFEVQSFIIPASAVNAPHQRYRTWIVAHTDSRLRRGGRTIGSSGENGQRGLHTTQEEQTSHDLRSKTIRRNTVRGETENVAYTDSQRGCLWETDRQNAEDVGQSPRCKVTGNWDFEPNVGRVVDGLPNRVDRLRGLGNAIVPQIAYQIGMAIMSTYD